MGSPGAVRDPGGTERGPGWEQNPGGFVVWRVPDGFASGVGLTLLQLSAKLAGITVCRETVAEASSAVSCAHLGGAPVTGFPMVEIARICKEAAKQEPERHFATPAALVDEIMLTRGEKLATLERWRLNLLRQLGAMNEGMPSRGFSSAFASQLREIEDARHALDPSLTRRHR